MKHWFIGGVGHGRRYNTRGLPLYRLPVPTPLENSNACVPLHFHEYRYRAFAEIGREPQCFYVWDKFPKDIATSLCKFMFSATVDGHSEESMVDMLARFDPTTGYNYITDEATHPLRDLQARLFRRHVCQYVKWKYVIGKKPICEIGWLGITDPNALILYHDATREHIASIEQLARDGRLYQSWTSQPPSELTGVTVSINGTVIPGARVTQMPSMSCWNATIMRSGDAADFILGRSSELGLGTDYTRSMVRGPTAGRREQGEKESWDEYMKRVKARLDETIARGTKAKDILAKLET